MNGADCALVVLLGIMVVFLALVGLVIYLTRDDR